MWFLTLCVCWCRTMLTPFLSHSLHRVSIRVHSHTQTKYWNSFAATEKRMDIDCAWCMVGHAAAHSTEWDCECVSICHPTCRISDAWAPNRSASIHHYFGKLKICEKRENGQRRRANANRHRNQQNAKNKKKKNKPNERTKEHTNAQNNKRQPR